MAGEIVFYEVEKIHVFVEGKEIDKLSEFKITPKGDQDSVKPIKDWSGKTIAYAKKADTDCEGSIKVASNSESIPFLIELANSKRPVQVVMVAETEGSKVQKITADNCVFFYPDASPEGEKMELEFKFIGTDFKME
jgi:hypothetical protein